MGTLERKNQSEIRRTKVNKAIIAAIGAAGIITLGMVAPNVLGALGKMGFLPQRKNQIRNTLSRMIKAGYVKLEKKEAGTFVRLTEKGELFLASSQDRRELKQKKWDGKWRIVMYDLKEPAKTLRARIRSQLHEWNFVKLQNSVWVTPHDCEDLIILFKADNRIGKNLLYIIADQIENDRALRQHFSLPTS